MSAPHIWRTTPPSIPLMEFFLFQTLAYRKDQINRTEHPKKESFFMYFILLGKYAMNSQYSGFQTSFFLWSVSYSAKLKANVRQIICHWREDSRGKKWKGKQVDNGRIKEKNRLHEKNNSIGTGSIMPINGTTGFIKELFRW